MQVLKNRNKIMRHKVKYGKLRVTHDENGVRPKPNGKCWRLGPGMFSLVNLVVLLCLACYIGLRIRLMRA
jgi:hypothetical protein